MNSEDNPEKSSFIEDAVYYMQIALSPEDVQNLLNDDKVWERMVTAANLARDEAEAIREGLREKNHTVTQVKDRHQMKIKCRKRFLELYPLVKKDVEDHIAQLQALAEKADKVHRDCKISNVVASSSCIVSGIMTVVAIVLDPVTPAVSLALSMTGMGLCAASAVTGVTTSVVESKTMTSIESRAHNLESNSIDPEKVFNKVLHDHNDPVASTENHLFRNLEDIGRKIRTIKLLGFSPHLSDQATSRLKSHLKSETPEIGNLKSETISAQTARVLQSADWATVVSAVSVSQGIRRFGAATTGFLILVDLVNLVQDSIDLHKGAKIESAEKLRLWIQELEVLLEKLKKIYNRLI